MSDAAPPPLFSPYWYKLGHLAPRLRPSIRLTRRVEGGEVWHVLSSPEANKHFRLDEASYAIVGALDGRTTLDAIWQRVLERFGDAAPGQDETIRLLGQLHQADALNSGSRPTMAEYARRGRKQRRQAAQQYFKNPLFLRIPLFDPHKIIEATFPFVRPFFSLGGLALWGLLMLWLAVQVVSHWDQLFATFADQALAVDNLIIAALVFPVAKALHELAHGWAVRRWGGTVREFGIMFLVFLPAPFVDASAAAAFRRKSPRIIVSAAGMMFEAVLAAFAMMVWLNAETGLVSAFAFNVMLVAGVSTFLFNGNPLLRFDAYFMLSDALEIQNLATRSQQWWGWLTHRFGFGLEQWDNPARTRREAIWFAIYHPASYAYRVFLTLTIALFVASSYPVIGLTLAVWSITTTFCLPLAKALWHVATGPRVKERRGRAVFVTALLLGAPLAVLAFAPVPHGTVAAGVVQLPEGARLLAPSDAIVMARPASAGAQVQQGATLAQLDAPLLRSEVAVLDARLQASLARLAAYEAQTSSAGRAAAERAEVAFLNEDIAGKRADLGALELAAPDTGKLAVRPAALVPGQRLSKGAEMGLVVTSDARVRLRVAVPASAIDLVQTSVAANASAAVRHPGRPFEVFAASIQSVAPKSTRQLFAPALAASAGGPYTMDPTDQDAARTLEPFHIVEVDVDLPLSETAVGALLWVRVDHGPSPLAPRIWRAMRQTFLSRLAI